MPSSLGMFLASRVVSGILAVESESCARFRPAIETSSVTTNPDGVRADGFEDSAACLAMNCSRRAFALSLLSS